MMQSLKKYASLVAFAHTLFPLPFALIAFALALRMAQPYSIWLLFIQVLMCMVTARNCAMSFNRYVDRIIDAQNQRTKERELPSGRLSPRAVVVFFMVNVFLFFGVSLSINLLCFYLAFPALAVLCGYSYTKRFTLLCHFVLGLALAIAPAGAFIAVTGAITTPVWLLCLMVALWVSGFDILYSLPDDEHDRMHNLHSIPARFGRKGALIISAGLHALVLPLLFLFGRSAQLSSIYWAAAMIFTGMLGYQHAILKVGDISKLNRAFFTANGMASVLFAGLTIIDLIR
jgi:4-hydroxybenzoate polyprenyltransferase